MNQDLEQPEPPRRPASWTAFGIVNIVFGAIGILGAISSLTMLSRLGERANDPMTKMMVGNPDYIRFVHWSTPLAIAAAAALLAAGIGLLKLRSWGRTLSLAYAWYALASGLATLVVLWILVFHPLLEQAQAKEGTERMAMLIGAIAGMIGGAFGLIYPVLLLIFMWTDARLRPADG